jgi:hypothetical protein
MVGWWARHVTPLTHRGILLYVTRLVPAQLVALESGAIGALVRPHITYRRAQATDYLIGEDVIRVLRHEDTIAHEHGLVAVSNPWQALLPDGLWWVARVADRYDYDHAVHEHAALPTGTAVPISDLFVRDDVTTVGDTIPA